MAFGSRKYSQDTFDAQTQIDSETTHFCSHVCGQLILNVAQHLKRNLSQSICDVIYQSLALGLNCKILDYTICVELLVRTS